MRDAAHEPATKGDLGVMRSDMAMMRTDIASMRTDIASMHDDLTLALRKEIREALRPIFITLAHHTGELADIRGHIKDKMVTRDEFHSRMDGFAGRVEDFGYSSAKNRSRLDDHEKRIIALEEKRA